jgi:hypothetical protein
MTLWTTKDKEPMAYMSLLGFSDKCISLRGTGNRNEFACYGRNGKELAYKQNHVAQCIIGIGTEVDVLWRVIRTIYALSHRASPI